MRIPIYDQPQVQAQGIPGGLQQRTESQNAKVLGLAGQATQIALSEWEKNQNLQADEASAKFQIENRRRLLEAQGLRGINALKTVGKEGAYPMPPQGPPPEKVSEPGKMPTDPNAAGAQSAAVGMMTGEAKAQQAKSRAAIETEATVAAMKDLSGPLSPYSKFYGEMDEQVKALANGLSGKAKDRFLKDAWLHRESFTNSIMGHQLEQQRGLAMETGNAKVAGYLDIIAKAPGTQVAKNAINDLENFTRGFHSQWTGLSGEALDNNVKTIVSAGLVQEIKSMLIVDPTKAQGLMEQAQSGGRLTPDHELAISKEVNAAASKRFAQDQAGMIKPGTTPAEAIAWFNKQKGAKFEDPDTREKFRVLVHQQFAEFKQDDAARADAAGAAVFDVFTRSKNNPWAVLNSPELARYREQHGKEGEAAYLHYKQLAEDAENKREPKMTPDQMWEWKSKYGAILYDDDLPNWTENKLKAQTIGMPAPLRNHLQDVWQELKTRGGKKFNIDKAQAQTILFKAGAIKNEIPTSKEDKALVGDFIVAMEALSPSENKVINWNDKEILKYGARWATETKIKNGNSFMGITFGEKNVPLFKVMEMVPPEFRQSAIAAGKAKGFIPSEETIALAYAEQVTAGEVKPEAPKPAAGGTVATEKPSGTPAWKQGLADVGFGSLVGVKPTHHAEAKPEPKPKAEEPPSVRAEPERPLATVKKILEATHLITKKGK